MEIDEAQRVVMRDGTEVAIRSIRAEDAAMLQAFFRRLSARSRRFRFFSATVDVSPQDLNRLVRVDPCRGVALVALAPRSAQPTIIAEARCVVDRESSAEFAIAVADEFQRKGLGTMLLETLLARAARTGIRRLVGEILAENYPMLNFVRRLGFRIRTNALDATTLIASTPMAP
jgi:acetyltransferase